MAPAFSAPVQEDDLRLVRVAAAYRLKYRISDARMRIAPQHVGFHPKNRGGEPPCGERCEGLFGDIFKSGFDPEEADCGGVLVQERPGQQAVHVFNVKACEGSAKLSAPVGGMSLTYGSLAHGHLSQVFKNVLAKIATTVLDAADQNRYFDVTRIAARDLEFGVM